MQTLTEGQPQDLFGAVTLPTAMTRDLNLKLGNLIDVTVNALQAGLRIPVAVTRDLWNLYIEQPSMVDETRRVMDVLIACRAAKIGLPTMQCRTDLEFYCTHHVDESGVPMRSPFKVILGPDEHGEPVLTVLMLNEDL